MDRKPKVRQKPRISAPKLGDYLDTRSASARDTMLLRQKFPSTFITARYAPTFLALRAAFLSQGDTGEYLRRSAEKIAKAPTTTKWEVENRDLNLSALLAFSNVVKKIEKPGRRFGPAPADGFTLRFEGVAVSVTPLLRVVRSVDGVERHGLVLAILRKDKVSDRAGKAVAEMLRLVLTQEGKEVDPKLCMVVDVFTNVIHTAPARGRQLRDEIVAACREIALKWDGLTMPGVA